MGRAVTELFSREELAVYALISRHDGMKAREIAKEAGLDKSDVSRMLVSSALMREMCYQDSEYRWHAVVRQGKRHEGLYEFSGWYGTVREFLDQEEEAWLEQLTAGCQRIGRSLNDQRGLIHSFRDCRETMRRLFGDLREMTAEPFGDWEIVFELRMNRARWIRIYADVLVITPERVFSLEFKMKKETDPEEVLQAAKYAPYLEILFGKDMDVIPALVLTGARDLFTYETIGKTDYVLPVVSGDMLFNVLNEYMGFLQE